MDNKFTINQELLKKVAILYVEDEPMLINSIKPILTKLFENVYIATNGQEALEIYTQHQNEIDIILSDFNLPIMNGLSLLEEIRNINKDVPFVFISAFLEQHLLLRCIELDVSHFAEKPADIKKILQHISKALELLHAKRLIQIKQKEIDEYLQIINQIAIISKTDREGKITFANEIFCEISGYSKEELIGESHNIIRHPEMQKKIYTELWETIQQGKIWRGKLKNKAKNGEPYNVNTTIFPIFDDSNEAITGYMSVRFLTTEDDLKAKIFKSQVIQQVSEFRNSKIEYENKILTLETENFKLKNNDFYEKRLADEIEKNKKLVNQINHYEKKLSQDMANYEERITIAKENFFTLDEENKKMKNSVSILKQELIDREGKLECLRNNLSEAKDEIDFLERRIIELNQIIEYRTRKHSK